MKTGDHVWVSRVGYTHHGILLDDGRVAHYVGAKSSKLQGSIRATSLEEFLDSGVPLVREYEECDPVWEVLARARSRLGERSYCFFTNNCEHFATWCKTGKSRSSQLERGMKAFFCIAGAILGMLFFGGAGADGGKA